MHVMIMGSLLASIACLPCMIACCCCRSITKYTTLQKMGAVALLENLSLFPASSYEAMGPTSLDLLERLHCLGQIIMDEEEM